MRRDSSILNMLMKDYSVPGVKGSSMHNRAHDGLKTSPILNKT